MTLLFSNGSLAVPIGCSESLKTRSVEIEHSKSSRIFSAAAARPVADAGRVMLPAGIAGWAARGAAEDWLVGTAAAATGVAAAASVDGLGAVKGAATGLSPMITLPDPPMMTLPWPPVLPSVAAGRPLISTVLATAPTIGLPQADVSLIRAAGRLSKKTFGEPVAMGFVPWPGMGQEVGSVWRAAGFPLMVLLPVFVPESYACRPPSFCRLR